MKPPLIQGNPDDFQTPPEALEPLYPYLKKGSLIWEYAEGKGNLTKALNEHDYDVFHSDILSGTDFLTTTMADSDWDYIITNPPFSLKQQFLERAYSLGRPFAFLLPLTTFETAKRQALFEKHGVQVIFFDKRINFEKPGMDKSGSWFATAWFTWGLNLPKDLNFVKLNAKS